MTNLANKIWVAYAALLPLLAIQAPRGMVVALAVGALLALITTPGFFARAHLKASAKNLLIPLGILALFALSTWWGDSPRRYEMLRDVTIVGMSGSVLFSAARLWPPAQLPLMLRAFAISSIAALVFFASQMALDYPLYRALNAVPPDFSIYESNIPKRTAALVALFTWPAALYFYLRHKHQAALTLLALGAIICIISPSRAAMLGITCGIITFGLTFWRVRLGATLGLLVLPLAMPLALALALSLPQLPPQVPQALDASSQYRLLIWNFTARQTLQHLPHGVGLDGARSYGNAGEVAPFEEGRMIPEHPHNVYLQLWLEFGLVGALLFTLLSLLLWRRLCLLPKAVQPFVWGYVICAAATLAIAYGAWQAWWLAGHALGIILLFICLRLHEHHQH